MNAFETKNLLTFLERAEPAGFKCRPRPMRGKLLIELSAQGSPAGKLEFYHPDEPRFGQVRAEYRDRVRDLWTAAKTAGAVSDRASKEFEHYLRIYEPYRYEYVEFSAIADCVIHLYESEGMKPPAREELIGDLAAIEHAYELWRRR
jgi:hypothetical protein